MAEQETPPEKGDLSVTALYTSQVWLWGGLKYAKVFALPESKVIFNIVNAALWFMRLFNWSLTSLKHSLLHRHTMIDYLLKRSGCQQVLELACGLSRRGAAFSANDDIRYTEVDLDHVIARKKTLMDASELGQEISARPNHRLLVGDVSQAPLESFVEEQKELFVISEGLLMYLKPDEQQTLWKKIAAVIQDCGQGTYVFDLVPWVEQPQPGPIGRCLEWFMKRITGGRSFERDMRTRHDIRHDLVAAGFQSVDIYEPKDVTHDWELPFPKKRTQQVIFVCKV